MDVNDLPKVATPANLVGAGGTNQQTNSKSLASATVSALGVSNTSDPKDSVDLQNFDDLDAKLKANNKIEISKDLNDIISVINQTSDSIGKVDQLVSSIDGLVEQVIRPDFPQDRVEILQREANEIASEIKKIRNSSPDVGNSPEADYLRQRLEQSIGNTSGIVLPQTKDGTPNIGQIDFSTKENIASVRINIELAKAQVSELKDQIKQGKDQIGKAISANDVAETNREASNVSLRDLDQALSLAGKAKNSIATNPEAALASFSSVKNSYTDLLS